MEQKFLYVIIGAVVSSLAFSFFVFYQIDKQNSPWDSTNMQYNKTAMWQVHDVIVDGKITAFTNDLKPYVILQVNKYYKNPQNATHLTIWGNFGLNDEYCTTQYNNCGNIVAYLYKNENGVYSQGEVFGRISNSCDARCITGMR